MRIFLCDDDKRITAELENCLLSYFGDRHLPAPEIRSFNDAGSLLADGSQPDIAFLDIEMPGMSGIEAGRLLSEREPRPLIIILTSYIEYLDDAMRFHVFRYLTKPVDRRRLERNLSDALAAIESESRETAIETKAGVRKVRTTDILFIESLGKSVTVHLENEDIDSLRKLDDWEIALAGLPFVRTHKSFLVNLQHVVEITRDTVYLDKGGRSAYLSRRNYAQVRNRYLRFLESTR
ncbi:MAG: LytTR family DNA-binding domain-containing protein [Lachnospiraceae bacterium]|nr:LytTR family DNA-binding domain-containing protein [Lachnospiraceae bacterium]MEE3437782.1 LytTR family DNA-binding domain-containing protein [Lachnospiraceae bacterium]MEE3457453.1 LytTR family DNA-binding domain-containing protein [Lachnospiraceae bacterium]